MEENKQINEKCIESDLNFHGPRFGKRHIQCILLFFVSILTYWTRNNMSMAIVAMTNSNATNTNFPEFDWKEQEKSYILSSFFWGYVFTQLPGGLLAKRYGSKMLLLSSVLVPAILTMLVPTFATYGGWEVLCAARAVQGMATGVVFPAFHTHLSKWCPAEERNRIGGFSYSGAEIGVVIAFISSGFIAASDLGWPGIFYITGTAGIVWSGFWIYFGANTPNEVASITAAEKRYIQATSGKNEEIKTYRIPWLAIFTSVPFIGLICARLSQAWGAITILTEMPTYMSSVLQLDIESNGLVSAFPYVVMWILGMVFIFLAEIFAKRKNANLVVMRKIYTTIALGIPALALIGFSFVTKEEIPLAVALLAVTLGANAAMTLGTTLNHIDLAPNFAGPLMGIVNTFANTINLVVPLIVGGIVTNEKEQSQWQIVFWLSAVVLLAGNLIFVIFGQATIQPWNDLTIVASNTRRQSQFVDASNHVIK